MTQNKAKLFLDCFLDIITEAMDEDEMDSITPELLFKDENNYNNADITSGQIVFTETEIAKWLPLTIDTICTSDNRCTKCYQVLAEEDCKTEDIYYGYNCSNCGHKEDF